MPQSLRCWHVRHRAEYSKATDQHHAIDDYKPDEVQHWWQCRHKHDQQYVFKNDSFETHG